VIGDMMFQIGLRNARARALIAHLVGTMLRSGPTGLLRLLKNALRHVTGRGEHPACADWWHRALENAGFAEVAVHVLDHEGGIAVTRRTGEPRRTDWWPAQRMPDRAWSARRLAGQLVGRTEAPAVCGRRVVERAQGRSPALRTGASANQIEERYCRRDGRRLAPWTTSSSATRFAERMVCIGTNAPGGNAQPTNWSRAIA
jgi:hypothetical protein